MAGRVKKFKARLVVSCSWADFQVLLMLGFPVAPATRLESFRHDEIDTFCTALGLPRRSRHPAVGGTAAEHPDPNGNAAPISLVLVGWGVADVNNHIPGGLDGVQAHLQAMHGMLRLPVDVFTVWQSPPAEIEQLRSCHAGDAQDLRGAMVDSLTRNGHRFVPAPAVKRPDFFKARQEWLSLRGPGRSPSAPKGLGETAGVPAEGADRAPARRGPRNYRSAAPKPGIRAEHQSDLLQRQSADARSLGHGLPEIGFPFRIHRIQRGFPPVASHPKPGFPRLIQAIRNAKRGGSTRR